MDKAQAIHAFWSRFGIQAWDENTVDPDTAEYPRLTYSVAESEIDSSVVLNASLWYRNISWAAISNKANEIAAFIGPGGHLEPYEGGAIWITKASPFIQRMADPDTMIRRIVLTIYAEFLSD